MFPLNFGSHGSPPIGKPVLRILRVLFLNLKLSNYIKCKIIKNWKASDIEINIISNSEA